MSLPDKLLFDPFLLDSSFSTLHHACRWWLAHDTNAFDPCVEVPIGARSFNLAAVQRAIYGMEEATDGGRNDEPATDTVIISPLGDLVLEICDKKRGNTFFFRVVTERLRQSSPYFDHLLHAQKFSEGVKISAATEQLKLRYSEIADAPIRDLPTVKLSDVGKISSVSSIKPLVADFLRVLHGFELSVPAPPLANLANLAIVADRFDALSAVAEHVRKRGYLEALERRSRGKPASPIEERIRQRLLLGVLFDHPAWLASDSKQLIATGSVCWKQDAKFDADAALWWDLPRGLEDELIRRREFALETIESLPIQFVNLYSSNERQCTLGYGSSLQCDSYQLGEMIRFFRRANLIRLEGALQGAEAEYPYSGNVERVMDTLRQCSSYQIDRHHTHCGLRARLIPILDSIDPYLRPGDKVLDIGICGDCWRDSRAKYAWSEAKRPLVWRRSASQGRISRNHITGGGEACLASHLRARDMFMAASREWVDVESRVGEIDSHITLGHKRV